MMLVVSLVVHIFQMGIKLPYAISSLGKDAGSSGVINNAEQIEVAEENAKTGASDNVVTFSGASLKDEPTRALRRGMPVLLRYLLLWRTAQSQISA